MARVAIGGWQHETNTFASVQADFAAFAMADEWPPLSVGEALFSSVRGMHLPIAGAIEALQRADVETVPLLWCSATPCAHVTDDAFSRISAQLIDRIGAALPLDGIYLDLHGAMVTESCQDGEGELLRRIRERVGSSMPVFISLDLHANVTPLMFEQATLIDIYRTYPHIDMAETGFRTAQSLVAYLADRRPLAKAFQQIDFLIPLNTGSTLIEPCRHLYRAIPGLLSDEVCSLAFACGFHLSDIHDVGPAVVGYGREQSAVSDAVGTLAAAVNGSQHRFYDTVWSLSDGVTEAIKRQQKLGGTIVLADTQDNPGGGGTGDTVGLLNALIASGASQTLVGMINDAQTATRAHEHGAGAVMDLQLGGKTGRSMAEPVTGQAGVIALSAGQFTATGPMYRGANMDIGLTALLEIQGIHVVVSSKAVQCADQQMFRHIGIDPWAYRLVAVKSSVHFRNDFVDRASDILIIAAPGEVVADPGKLSYRHARPQLTITSLSRSDNAQDSEK